MNVNILRISVGRFLARIIVCAFCAALMPSATARAEFVYPKNSGDPLIYGVKNGIIITVHPYSADRVGNGGPRGLIRIGCEENGKCFLFNFVAVEPLVGIFRGLSELDKGNDGQQGKPFRVANFVQDFKVEASESSLGRILKQSNPFKAKEAEFKQEATAIPPGRIIEYPEGRALTFAIQVEPYGNGARPVVEVTLFEKMPQRVRFRVFSAGGCRMNQCTLTATMGNLARCRNLWLESGAVYAPDLYAGFHGDGFAERRSYTLNELHKMPNGDIILAATPDEYEPNEVWPLPATAVNPWHYPGRWMTQYWMKRNGTYDASLRGRANGRQSYWGTGATLPGGVAFENFELRENFKEGQEIWFGYTYDSPRKAFGFGYDVFPISPVTRGIPETEQKSLAEGGTNGGSLVNGEFQNGLSGWQLEDGAAGFKVFQQGADRAVSTYGEKRDKDRGRMYQCVRIPEDAEELVFFLHGGCDRNNVYVALWNGDREIRRMTARDSNVPFEVRWNVKPLRGDLVTLEICDFSIKPWGFIGAHGFRFQ